MVKYVKKCCTHANGMYNKQGHELADKITGTLCYPERCVKRGKREKGQKRQGYRTEWLEPRLLTISQFDKNGQKIKSVSPIMDGSCGSMDDFFDLLKEYLLWINLDEASEITF